MKMTKAENGVDIEFMNDNSNLVFARAFFHGPKCDGRILESESEPGDAQMVLLKGSCAKPVGLRPTLYRRNYLSD